jgi:hypothetical protein
MKQISLQELIEHFKTFKYAEPKDVDTNLLIKLVELITKGRCEEKPIYKFGIEPRTYYGSLHKICKTFFKSSCIKKVEDFRDRLKANYKANHKDEDKICIVFKQHIENNFLCNGYIQIIYTKKEKPIIGTEKTYYFNNIRVTVREYNDDENIPTHILFQQKVDKSDLSLGWHPFEDYYGSINLVDFLKAVKKHCIDDLHHNLKVKRHNKMFDKINKILEETL